MANNLRPYPNHKRRSRLKDTGKEIIWIWIKRARSWLWQTRILAAEIHGRRAIPEYACGLWTRSCPSRKDVQFLVVPQESPSSFSVPGRTKPFCPECHSRGWLCLGTEPLLEGLRHESYLKAGRRWGRSPLPLCPSCSNGSRLV